MKHFSLYIISLCFLISSGFTAGAQEIEKDHPEQEQPAPDGPYIFHLPDGRVRVISVNQEGEVSDQIFTLSPESSFPVFSHEGNFLFDVTLHPISRPDWKYQQPEEFVVMSDPHGNWDCLVSTLLMNGVIDQEYRWKYGANHLMILGDVFDRGNDVLPIFWLIYKLEQEAEQAGGRVSFMLGNHEPMVLANDVRYVEKKYAALSEQVGVDYAAFFGPDTELGRWLGTRNTIEIIGNDLFVHAGLGEAFLEQNLSIPQVNEEMSRGLFMTKEQRNQLSPLTEFLYGSVGPIWYRGMVRNDKRYYPLEPETLDRILDAYGVQRVIVGHTIFPDIVSFYNGKVIDVNVNNQKNFDQVLGRGILIKAGKTYIISDKGILRTL